jgi:hypothetical protein
VADQAGVPALTNEMTLTTLLVVIHVFSAFATVAGIIGRNICSAQLARAQDLDMFLLLSDLTGRFEYVLVRGPSLVLFASGILLAFLEGYPLLGFVQGGAVNWLLVSNLLVLSIIGLIIFVFVPRDKVFAAALEDSKRKGLITPELRATFRDPVLIWAHRWENLAGLAVIFLMIVKPF